MSRDDRRCWRVFLRLDASPAGWRWPIIVARDQATATVKALELYPIASILLVKPLHAGKPHRFSNDGPAAAKRRREAGQ